eukprot:scaffold1818_cov162-Amphora_coffeaeformis.AAC.13
MVRLGRATRSLLRGEIYMSTIPRIPYFWGNMAQPTMEANKNQHTPQQTNGFETDKKGSKPKQLITVYVLLNGGHCRGGKVCPSAGVFPVHQF